MSTITYKTVIANAIEGFNDIQKKIYDNSGQLSTPTTTSPASVTNIIGALKPATCTITGGTLTSGSGSVSASNATLSSTNSSGISVTGSGSVSMSAITTTHTAGLTSASTTTSVNSTSKSSSGATKYITALTVPASKALSVTTNGTVNMNDSSAGSVIWDGWKISISKSSSEDTLVFDPVE